MSSANTYDQILNPELASAWLESLGIEDTDRGFECLRSIHSTGVADEMLGVLCSQLANSLPQTADPDSALQNLDRFINASRSAAVLIGLFERDPEAMQTLLQIFSTSQYLADQLVSSPSSFDLVRISDGAPVSRSTMLEILRNDLQLANDEKSVMSVLRKFKQGEMLRIAYGDFIRDAPLDRVTEQLAFLADTVIQGAIDSARKLLAPKYGEPIRADQQPARFVVLALGKLGGQEPDYSSDLNLMFLCERAERVSGSRSIGGDEYFDRLGRLILRLLTHESDAGSAYRINLSTKAGGDKGPIVSDINSALRYYDFTGRTWERQALIKARPAAGDVELGERFMRLLEPWIYRRYLNRVDIAGIRHIKRRIQRHADLAEDETRNVKVGPGGIDEIELLIQFLQLLNGSDLEPIRIGHTLKAIAALEQVGCLTPLEASMLSENYKFFRNVEHHLQIMFDLATYTVPEDPAELKRFCWRIGYRGVDVEDSLGDVARFEKRMVDCQVTNRKILDHLLHDAFGDEDDVPMETDLVLDPEPSESRILEVLQPYAFSDPHRVHQLLMELGREKIPFLSARRCRHFLAVIAPQLLSAVAKTPDPLDTLENMARVSDSLGGKSALWELASFAPATLDMVVRLSAVGPYLTGILISNPGMVDELMDSLTLDRLPQYEEMNSMATELCRSAEDVARILFSFRNSVHLRVGVRDILGKDDIEDTHVALSDCAEVCLQAVVADQYESLAQRFGDPGNRDGEGCEFVILAVGKLGGKEPNYHSSLDLMFLYETESFTRPRRGGRKEGTTNNHFFNQLSQRVAQVFNGISPQGKLYEVDTSLTPSGGRSIVAVPFPQLSRYFNEGNGTLWERLSLCKARPVFGSDAARKTAMETVHEVIAKGQSVDGLGEQVRQLRAESEQGAAKENLKRASGGTLDIELAVEMLQLKHTLGSPGVLVPGTLGAIEALRAAKVLSEDEASIFADGYRFLRRIESALRLMNTAGRHELPSGGRSLDQLTYLLNYQESVPIQERCDQVRLANRKLFEELCARC